MNNEEILVLANFLQNLPEKKLEELNNENIFNAKEKDFLSYLFVYYKEDFLNYINQLELISELEKSKIEKTNIVQKIINNIQKKNPLMNSFYPEYSFLKDIEKFLLNSTSKKEIDDIFNKAGIEIFYYKNSPQDFPFFLNPYFIIKPGKFFETYKLINKLIKLSEKIKELEKNLFQNKTNIQHSMNTILEVFNFNNTEIELLLEKIKQFQTS